MVGDRWRDVAAGNAAGCRTVQVGSLDEGALSIEATKRRDDLAGAVSWILAQGVRKIDP
ncbi:MAG: HAD hydrolase-like protein [Acidimicrobiales bacterium]